MNQIVEGAVAVLVRPVVGLLISEALAEICFCGRD